MKKKNKNPNNSMYLIFLELKQRNMKKYFRKLKIKQNKIK